MRIPRILFLLLLCGQNAICQRNAGQVRDSTSQNARLLFYSKIGSDSHLYTGMDYINYDPVIKGNPFFNNDQVVTGTVFYDGTIYRDIPMQYDLVSQKLLVNRYHERFRISLVDAKVGWFDLSGHHFQPVLPGPGIGEADAAGFFDILVPGKVSLVVKRIKRIRAGIRPEDPIIFSREDLYYIHKDQTFYPLTGKTSLLDALSDQKAAIKSFIHHHHFRFRKKNITQEEEAYRSTVAYYLTLNRQR
jgi:hypothetical protein